MKHRIARGAEASGQCVVKLIEHRAARAQSISGALEDGLVLLGDATDEDLLRQEGIDDADLFLALTNDDESNIMAASLAKSMGCRRVVALINRSYADLVQGGSIDVQFRRRRCRLVTC